MSKSYTDEQLVEHLRKSNKSAFEVIYERYWYKLFCIAYHKLGLKEEAEELVHDLFESIWVRREEAQIRNLGIYLVLSMKYLIANHIKSQITWKKYRDYLILNKIQQSYSTDEIVGFSDLQKAVEKIMLDLPEKTSAIFHLSRFEGMSVKDIAQQFNLTEKAVEYHLTKTQKILNKRLWMFHSDN